MADMKQIFDEYIQNLRRGEEIYRVKKQQIKDARDAFRQIMPESSVDIATDRLLNHGNNDSSDGTSYGYSSYFLPTMRAVADKIIQDLTTNPFRFEYDGNNKIGWEIRNALSAELRNIFTYENNKRAMNLGFWHAVVSGTMITQTITKARKKQVIKPNMKDENGKFEVVSIPNGRGIELLIYDPLTVIPDWNASPRNPRETMDWCIVTVGEFTKEWVEQRWPNLKEEPTFQSYEEMDQHKQDLERDAGMDKDQAEGTLTVREYYKRDGMRYVIVNDSVIAESTPNSNGSYGAVPINIAPILIDPDCVFGDTIFHMLRPSLEVASASVNQVLDRNSLNNNMPFFYSQDALPSFRDGMSLNDFDKNQLIPVDASNFGGNGQPLEQLMFRPQIPEVTQGAMWTYEKALEQIWIVTGLNPTTLGGVQEKQIRNADVAGMIQQSSLRNSSQIVANLETNFMNPTSWDILQIFDIYYDDFKSFKEANIPNGFLSDLSMVRVVNGSFLPGDQQNRLQKMGNILQLAMQNPNSFDFEKIYDQLLDAMGVSTPDTYMKDPLEMLTEQQTIQLLEVFNTQGPEGLAMFLQQQLQQMMAAQGGQGGA